MLAKAAAIILLTWALTCPAVAGPVERVIDGDDFCLCGSDDDFVRRLAGNSKQCRSDCVHVRICGIDAREHGQTGFDDARRQLRSLTKGRTVNCTQVGAGTVCDGRSRPTNRDRVVAQCSDDGRDIGQDMITSGDACDWVRFLWWTLFSKRPRAGMP